VYEVGLDKQKEALAPDEHGPSEVTDDDLEAAARDLSSAEQGADPHSQPPKPLAFDQHMRPAKFEADELLVQTGLLKLVDGDAQPPALGHDLAEQVVEALGVVSKDSKIVDVRRAARGGVTRVSWERTTPAAQSSTRGTSSPPAFLTICETPDWQTWRLQFQPIGNTVRHGSK